jgi:hypothetical protein
MRLDQGDHQDRLHRRWACCLPIIEACQSGVTVNPLDTSSTAGREH